MIGMRLFSRESTASRFEPAAWLTPWLAFVVMLFAADGVQAQRDVGEVKNVTQAELAALPAYCLEAQAFSPRFIDSQRTQGQALWFGKMGDTFRHIHHYCWALLNAGRARAPGTDPQVRGMLLGRAFNDCVYVVERAPKDFVLLPEIFLRMGQFAAEKGEIVTALEMHDRSRAAKRDYWPPYVEIAAINRSIGRYQVAEATLLEGLAIMPDEPRLKEALAALQAAAKTDRRATKAKP